MSEPRIDEVQPDSAAAQHCLQRYYAELAARFDGGFEVGRSRDPDLADLVRPRGAFLVAFDSELPVGCLGLKGDGTPLAEIKRMWIDPDWRGSGLAKRLMAAGEAAARELGIAVLRLDTNRALPEAIAVYRHWGWREIPRFNDDPYAEVFFEKAL
jgi:GNAT superfamily N-acetyltransferase